MPFGCEAGTMRCQLHLPSPPLVAAKREASALIIWRDQSANTYLPYNCGRAFPRYTKPPVMELPCASGSFGCAFKFLYSKIGSTKGSPFAAVFGQSAGAWIVSFGSKQWK